jgi:hypothetical protein
MIINGCISYYTLLSGVKPISFCMLLQPLTPEPALSCQLGVIQQATHILGRGSVLRNSTAKLGGVSIRLVSSVCQMQSAHDQKWAFPSTPRSETFRSQSGPSIGTGSSCCPIRLYASGARFQRNSVVVKSPSELWILNWVWFELVNHTK